jgi:hypothetical protein
VYFDAHTADNTYIQMIDSFGNLQVVAGGGSVTDFSSGKRALDASLLFQAASLGDQDNSLAFGSCVRRAHSAPHRDATSASPRDA